MLRKSEEVMPLVAVFDGKPMETILTFQGRHTVQLIEWEESVRRRGGSVFVTNLFEVK